MRVGLSRIGARWSRTPNQSRGRIFSFCLCPGSEGSHSNKLNIPLNPRIEVHVVDSGRWWTPLLSDTESHYKPVGHHGHWTRQWGKNKWTKKRRMGRMERVREDGGTRPSLIFLLYCSMHTYLPLRSNLAVWVCTNTIIRWYNPQTSDIGNTPFLHTPCPPHKTFHLSSLHVPTFFHANRAINLLFSRWASSWPHTKKQSIVTIYHQPSSISHGPCPSALNLISRVDSHSPQSLLTEQAVGHVSHSLPWSSYSAVAHWTNGM